MKLQIRVMLTAALAVASANSFARDYAWIKVFGGNDHDDHRSVTAVADGIVAVGYSAAGSFNTGDWAGITGKGGSDAVIAKYDNNGTVVWKKHFGGSGGDYFQSVTAVTDGIVAVGFSAAGSFNTGDWAGITGKGSDDAIIVKYDNNGTVLWKKHFGGSGNDYYYSVTAVTDGIVAVGYSNASSFGNGDWAGITGKGSDDAIIVKYDLDGNVLWQKHFGGSDVDYYLSVTAVADGIVAVGSSYAGSFDNGDWAGITGKGSDDAIIVKYDNNGNVVWQKHFGGSGYDIYYSVTAVADGIVAAGTSPPSSFDNGDWAGITGKGSDDAIIVKYDLDGNVVWKKNFGGSNYDIYLSVTAVADGIVVVGRSYAGSFNNGDWTGYTSKGGYDAIIVKYDNVGNVVWQKNFGGSGADYYYGVTATADGIAAVGYAENASFGNGDLSALGGKGGIDAIVVKYLIPVTNIADVPVSAIVGTSLTLTGRVEPSDASYQTIVWNVTSNGGTGASVIGNTFFATAAGTAVVKATIVNGTEIGTNYEQGFYIAVSAFVPVTDITNVPSTATVGTPLTLTGTVVPSDAAYNSIVWSVTNDGGTYSTISGNSFTANAEGTAEITATIANGTAVGKDYAKVFYITVSNVGIGAVGTGGASSVRIYPNPTGGKFTILDLRLDDLKSNDLEFEIYDVVGQVVQSKIVNLKSKIEIDISHLAAGLYFLKIDGKTFKVVKQ